MLFTLKKRQSSNFKLQSDKTNPHAPHHQETKAAASYRQSHDSCTNNSRAALWLTDVGANSQPWNAYRLQMAEPLSRTRIKTGLKATRTLEDSVELLRMRLDATLPGLFKKKRVTDGSHPFTKVGTLSDEMKRKSVMSLS